MKPTEQTAKTQSPRTGIFATLCAHLRPKGTPTPSRRRASRTALCAALTLSAFALTATPALAAAPETPELTVKPIFASIATFNGTLSPKGLVPAEGSYKFLYRASKTECTGAGGKETAPGLALGGAPEPLPPEQVKGLTPSTEYTVCLSITNLTAETAKSAPVIFKTAAPAKPEPPEATGVEGRRATSAELVGVVNPLKEGEPGHYRFLYAQSASVCTGGAETPEGSTAGAPGETKFAEVSSLEPGKPYTFCVKAINALGEFTLSTPKTFTAAIPPEAPEESPATEVTSSSATFNGVLNPHAVGEPGKYQFLYRQNATECQGEGEQATAPASSTAASPQPVSAIVTGLHPGAPYSFCLRAENAVGEVTVSAPEPLTQRPPSIEHEEATSITKASADLTATINPDGAAVTECKIEYGTSTGYGTPLPCEPSTLPSGTTAVPVTVHLTELSANTEYHWRLSATNAAGTTTTLDHTFVYLPGGEPLPDNRAYEMVTPPHKNAALIGDVFLGLEPQIADNGSRLIMSTVQCFGQAQSCPAVEAKVGTPYEFTRTSSGWQNTPLAPPASQFANNSVWSVDAEAGTSIFSMPPPSSWEYRWYGRAANGTFAEIGPTAPPGTLGQAIVGSITVHATADLSHLVYVDEPRWPFDGTKRFQENAAYEYVGGGNSAPLLVGVTGGHGSTDLISECGTQLGHEGADYNVMSADGSKVFFVAQRANQEPCPSGTGANAGIPVPADELFARIHESQTVPLSIRSPLECGAASGCLGSPPGDASYVGASSDGSKVVFQDTQQLTDNASEAPEGTAAGTRCATVPGSGCNLYLYDFANPPGRNLTAISAGDTSGEGPRLQGVISISPDGSHVYFIARGVLTAVPNSRGQTPRNGGENMYVYERDAAYPAGRVAFIATVPEADNEIDANAEWTSRSFTDNVTQEGRFLVFRSRGNLTADDSSTTGSAQVFRYDAQTAQLTRISVGENGFNDNGNANPGNAFFPAPTAETPARTDPTMSADGSYVFFDSPTGLTPGASNNVRISGEENSGDPPYAENVYEWHEGQVHLISDGRDTAASTAKPCEERKSTVCLLGTDATGKDVFFSTADQLVPEDGDTAMDVYDARVCTASEPCIKPTATPVPCEGEACHGPGSETPPVSSAGSATFSGPGNPPPATKAPPRPPTAAQIRARKLQSALKACRRKPRGRKRRACESKAHRSYGPRSNASERPRSRTTSKPTRKGF